MVLQVSASSGKCGRGTGKGLMLFSLVFFKVYNCYLFEFPFSVKTYVSV